jgi:hypothetical protein
VSRDRVATGQREAERSTGAQTDFGKASMKWVGLVRHYATARCV